VLHIHTSHRTEVLLDAFVESLAAERERLGAWATVQVVVPNGNVETYLRRGVAERMGIAANIETTFLRKFLAGIAERAVPDARVADAAAVEGHLLALLHDAGLLTKPELASVRAYLTAAGADTDAVDRRRCQLAVALAHLFDEYAASRPEMLETWTSNSRALSGETDLQTWQRELWLALFAPGGRLEKQSKKMGPRWLPLHTLWNEAMACSPTPFAGRTVHIFGLSYIATAYHLMLGRLAAASDIHLYTLNPCREEEDELRARPAPGSGDPFELDQEANPALALWARPGRENLRLLARVDGATFDARFPEGAATTLLQRLHNDIVARRTPAASMPLGEPDASLAIWPCPSLRRELEVVAAEIWNLLRKDPTLRMCEVAVIVPEAKKDLYLAQLPAVFGETCHLPHSVADLAASGSHRAAEAIARLIDLPFSSFSRKDLLPLLTHPCLMARFPSATPQAWRQLAAELGVVRGAHRRDWQGTYLGHDLFSWHQGFVRLALGAVADAADPDTLAPVTVRGEPYLPALPLGSDDEATLGFGLLARSLLADAAFASGSKGGRTRPIGEWLAFLRGMVESYVVVEKNDDAGRALVGHFLAALDGLYDHGLGDTPVSYRVAAELAKAALEGVPWSHGHYRASGVTVASFVPMRAIPFRAVFILGLGQDTFPQSGRRHELDLRRGQRLPGDVDGREQDLYMFLETLLSARDHLALSYVSRDEFTGDELPASPALLELRSMLGRGYLGDEALAGLFRDEPRHRPPLRRYHDTDQRREVLPAAEAEHRAMKLGRRLSAGARGSISPRRWLASLSPEQAEPLRRVLGLPAIAPSDSARPTTALKLRLSALRAFLEDPLQGSARFCLRMSEDDDEGLADIEDEPFDMGAMLSSSILRRSMSEAILTAQGTPQQQDLAACHARHAMAAELAGRCPSGIFRTPSASDEQRILQVWQEELPSLLGEDEARCRAFRFVPNLEAAHDEAEDRQGTRPAGHVEHRPAPSFALELPAVGGQPPRTVTVTIVGETRPWVSRQAAGDTALSFTTRKDLDPGGACKEDLAAFLDYAVLTASGHEGSRPGFASALFHAAKGSAGLRRQSFGPLSREHARDYLASLCAELIAGGRYADGSPTSVHPYLLPHEAVLASRAKGTPLALEIEKLSAKEDRREASFSSTRGPVPRATECYAPPSETEAKRMIEVRFGLFFELAESHGNDDGGGTA